MVHNGIEYGIMAAYSEGLNIIKSANVGRLSREVDAETTPLRNPEFYRYEFDIAEIAEVWRRSSVIGSWLLDLTAAALRNESGADEFRRTCLGFRRGALDLASGDRRRSPRPSHQRRLIWAFRIARACGICRQAAVGNAVRIRRPHRKTGKQGDH